MPDTIRDGQGTGVLAGVDSANRLLTSSVTYSAEHHANHEGNAYNMVFDVTPTAAGDCFLYIKNSNTADMVIEGLWLRVASAEQITMEFGNTGTPGGTSSAIVPTNLNAGANSTALGTFEAGNDITGVAAGTVLNKGWVANTATSFFNFEQDLIMPQNSVYTLWVVTGAVNLAGTIVFHYHTQE